MSLSQIFLRMMKLLIVFGISIESKSYWNYDVVSVKTVNETPDILYIDIQRTRLGRGVYTTSGSIDIKQDLNDDLRVTIVMYYSPTGSDYYAKTPFEIRDKTLSEFINTIYRDMLMESVVACVDNLESLSAKFEPPMAKRCVTFNNCKLSSETMPSTLRRGYYKLVIELSNQANSTITYIINIERET